MRFGPEIDDALGGRLSGAAFQLPNHCAAILRALLLNREPARLHIGTITGIVEDHVYELKFHTSPADELNGYLDAYRHDGLTEERDLSRKVSEKSNVRTYLMRRGNAAVALIQKTNSSTHRKRVYQAIAFLPRLLPGLFAEKWLSDTEKALLSAAFTMDYSLIEAHLETLYKESDLFSQRHKRLIHNAISYSLSLELRRAKDEVMNAEQNANSFLQRYMDQTRLAMEKRILAESLDDRIGAMSQDVDDIMDFLSSNKSVSVGVENNALMLDVTGPLTNFDPDAYRVIRDRPYAHFQKNIVGSQEDALLFFDALFLEESIKVNICARYILDPRSGVRGKISSVTQSAIPNPHIQYHQCLGQYAADMQAALSKSDFVGLISLCIASGLSLNIPESPTCGRFVKDVSGGSHRAVLLPTGETVSYKKAVAWLKQQKGITPESTEEVSELDAYSDDNETEERVFF